MPAPRDAVLDQLRHLLLEVEALEPLLARLPAGVLGLRLPGERSVLGALAAIARLDRTARLDAVTAVAVDDFVLDGFAEPDDAPEAVEADEAGAALGPTLAAVREARQALVAAVETLPAEVWAGGAEAPAASWGRRVAVADAARLRAVAYRLHEANLTARGTDLPK